jgi:hypothetical protein
MLAACHSLGVDVVQAFREFQPACGSAAGTDSPFDIAAWLSALAGSSRITEIAARSGLSRYAVARSLQGRTQPRLHDFLALTEAISGRASDLVQALVPIEQVPELHAVARRRTAAKRLAFDELWSPAVLRVLETTEYQAFAGHPAGYVARRLGLSPDLEPEIFSRLLEAGVIRRDGQRYEVGESMTVDTQASAADMAAVKSHWAAAGTERARAPREADWLGFNLVSTSLEDLERIREILRSAFREIRALAAASEPAESVALLNMHLVTWNDVTPTAELHDPWP